MFKGMKIDMIVLVARITNIERKKTSFNITLDDSSGQISVMVQKTVTEDTPQKLRDVTLEVNNYVEVIITPRRGSSDDRLFIVEKMSNLDGANLVTHHLLHCLEALMSAGMEYNPPLEDNEGGGSAIKEQPDKESQTLDLHGKTSAEKFIILAKKAENRLKRNKFEMSEIISFTQSHMDQFELNNVLRELENLAEVVKSNLQGKVFYELTG